jgi:hypothetical protein
MAAHKGHVRAGGRAKGTLNKVTVELKELARLHGPAGIERLAKLAMHSKSEMTSVAAIKELFDRGYGKAPQPHDGDGQGGPVVVKVITGVRITPR